MSDEYEVRKDVGNTSYRHYPTLIENHQGELQI